MRGVLPRPTIRLPAAVFELVVGADYAQDIAGEYAVRPLGMGMNASALYAHDVDPEFVSQVGVHKPFAHEGAVGADGHIGLMQVVDHGVFLAAAAQFAFVEVVEKFTSLCGSCFSPSLREK